MTASALLTCAYNTQTLGEQDWQLALNPLQSAAGFRRVLDQPDSARKANESELPHHFPFLTCEGRPTFTLAAPRRCIQFTWSRE